MAFQISFPVAVSFPPSSQFLFLFVFLFLPLFLSSIVLVELFVISLPDLIP